MKIRLTESPSPIGLSRIQFIPREILSWNDVSEIHRIRNGIYHRNGRLISLLTDFGRINPCYPDYHGETPDTIFYTGYGRRGDQKLDATNRALLDAIKSRVPVPLFNKLAVSRWEFTGNWRVIDGKYVFDEKQDRMIWKFTLQRVSGTFLDARVRGPSRVAGADT
jgi:hypothetical protein